MNRKGSTGESHSRQQNEQQLDSIHSRNSFHFHSPFSVAFSVSSLIKKPPLHLAAGLSLG
jgi:hypothetical protein